MTNNEFAHILKDYVKNGTKPILEHMQDIGISRGDYKHYLFKMKKKAMELGRVDVLKLAEDVYQKTAKISLERLKEERKSQVPKVDYEVVVKSISSLINSNDTNYELLDFFVGEYKSLSPETLCRHARKYLETSEEIDAFTNFFTPFRSWRLNSFTRSNIVSSRHDIVIDGEIVTIGDEKREQVLNAMEENGIPFHPTLFNQLCKRMFSNQKTKK